MINLRTTHDLVADHGFVHICNSKMVFQTELSKNTNRKLAML